jgi:photosystem II stability/assembly factor-like uncharacterized protein
LLLFAVAIILSYSFSKGNNTPPPPGNWQLQTNLQAFLFNGRTITDMTFIDSVTGFAIASAVTSPDTGFIFKTTNGGVNWFVNYYTSGQYSNSYTKIKFVSDSIGYACGGGGSAFLSKTTNRGNNWTKTNYSWTWSFIGISTLGKDTIYVCNDNSLVGGVFRTTNGGQNWDKIYSAGMYNPLNIYMFNARIGFYQNGDLYKTTNGGYNWNMLDSYGFSDIHFFDSLTGYRICCCGSLAGKIQKTTDGGINWTTQSIPNIPGGSNTLSLVKLFFNGIDTIWAVGRSIWYPNPARMRGIINKTTNGGLNWGYQLPDTNLIQIPYYNLINFSRNRIGLLYCGSDFQNYGGGGKGIYTSTGGDSTIYVGIIESKTDIIPMNYVLFQNFPNPFNPMTKIRFAIKEEGKGKMEETKLVIYDILGKEIQILVKEKLQPGTYTATFDGRFLSSGVYFFRLEAGNFIQVKKMVLIK